MSLATLYDKSIRSTTIEPPEKGYSPTEDATRKQLQISWLQSTVTQEMFEDVQKKIKEYQHRATIQALTSPDSHFINQFLIRAKELQDFIDTYGRGN